MEPANEESGDQDEESDQDDCSVDGQPMAGPLRGLIVGNGGIVHFRQPAVHRKD